MGDVAASKQGHIFNSLTTGSKVKFVHVDVKVSRWCKAAKSGLPQMPRSRAD